jgi:hypothetical protein
MSDPDRPPLRWPDPSFTVLAVVGVAGFAGTILTKMALRRLSR